MIEVTDEMLKVARSMQSFELMIKRIIELHEENKPKPKPLSDDELVAIKRNSNTPLAFARAIERAHGIGVNHDQSNW